MLQLSLDWMGLGEVFSTLQELHSYVDIIEVGTPLLFAYGLEAVKTVKEAYPDKLVLADMKIIDGGSREVAMAAKKQADIMTIMGAANDHTIQIAVEEAHALGCKMMVDLLGIADIPSRAERMDAIGVDYICVHTAFDMREQQERPVEALRLVKQVVKRAGTAIAGGITLKELDAVAAEQPDIVIVGGGILNAAHRAEAARQFKARC